jgi:hypothetical protein
VEPEEEDSGSPPVDLSAAEEEADQAARRNEFSFPDMGTGAKAVAEKGATAFPGDKEFQSAVDSLPPGLREKLKETLGAEFTSLRPVPNGRLRRPS